MYGLIHLVFRSRLNRCVSSFLNALKDLTSKTNSVVNEMHIAFPSVVLKNGIGVEMDEGLNLAGLVNSVNESVANVTYAGKVGVCAIGTLLNPASALNVIASVFDSIASVAADVMETITDAIAGQIEAILYDTIGSAFAVLEAVLSLLQSIVTIFNTIGKIVSQFTKIGELNLKDLYDQ